MAFSLPHYWLVLLALFSAGHFCEEEETSAGDESQLEKSLADVCEINGSFISPKLRVVKVFRPKVPNETLTAQGVEFIDDRTGWRESFRNGSFPVNAMVFFGCEEGYSLIRGSRLTCKRSDADKAPEWDGPLPSCELNVCWWFGRMTGVKFTYLGRELTDFSHGFPEGTQLTYLDDLCPEEFALVDPAPRCCKVDGTWSGSEPTRCTFLPKNYIGFSFVPIAVTAVVMTLVTIGLISIGLIAARHLCPSGKLCRLKT